MNTEMSLFKYTTLKHWNQNHLYLEMHLNVLAALKFWI